MNNAGYHKRNGGDDSGSLSTHGFFRGSNARSLGEYAEISTRTRRAGGVAVVGRLINAPVTLAIVDMMADLAWA